MQAITIIFALGNGVGVGVLLALFEFRTKTLAYGRARWLDVSSSHLGDLATPHVSQLRGCFGTEGASFDLDEATGGWQFQVDGYAATAGSALGARLAEPLSLTESIALMGAQPCYFFAEAAKSGKPGDWFGIFREYVLELDRAVWKKTARSLIAFHDHTCVVRLISLRHAAMVFRRELLQPANTPLRRLVAAMQARDLALLQEERLFDYQTNHGLITCLGLLHYALDVTAGERRPIVQGVVRWMSSREDFFISDDGVPLEMAQTYWMLIFLLLKEIDEVLGLLGERMAFPKLAKVEEFLGQYAIDGQVNRFGNSSLGHDLVGKMPLRHHFHFPHPPNKPGDSVTCRVLDTGLFVADWTADGRVCAQLVLNAQDVSPWIHGQQSQMAMGYFCDGVFWVDSPGRFTSGKKGVKARIDHYTNQSVPTRAGCGYVAGWRFERAEETPAGAVFYFALPRAGKTLLQRTVTIKGAGGFSISDSAPGGVVETRFLLPPGTETAVEGNILVIAAEGRRASFNFSGQAAFADGLISFQRNVALPAKLFCLRGESVQLVAPGPALAGGRVQVRVAVGYPYRKRETIAQRHPNSRLQQVSVKKLQLALAILFLADIIALAWGLA